MGKDHSDDAIHVEAPWIGVGFGRVPLFHDVACFALVWKANEAHVHGISHPALARISYDSRAHTEIKQHSSKLVTLRPSTTLVRMGKNAAVSEY
jgi:hypothetical protein